ncbi:hypothetical protein HYU22_03260 [Candidatus Woesearchaeota archaeon]|nr:hypothetical protein [Candidatus Woesearchaeota archaeon]
MTQQIPLYETLSRQLRAVAELDSNYHARFLGAWKYYFSMKDDPNRKEHLRQQAAQIIAMAEAGERPKPLYHGPVPQLDDASKALVMLDETLMWSPRDLQECVVGLVREYGSQPLSHLGPNERLGHLDTRLREFYDARKE